VIRRSLTDLYEYTELILGAKTSSEKDIYDLAGSFRIFAQISIFVG